MNKVRKNRQAIKAFNKLKVQAIESGKSQGRDKLSDMDWTAWFEGIAIDLLCSLRPRTVGASHNSMIWNTAARIGQLDMVREHKMLKNLEIDLQTK